MTDSVEINIVFLGPPGSGKGTQAGRLQEILKIPHVSTGNIFRDHMARGTELGEAIREVMESGGLVPDELADPVVEQTLQEMSLPGIMLDGYPRTAKQAATLDAMLERLDQKLNAVVVLQVPDEVIVERLAKRGRADDKPEIIRERLAIYAREAQACIEYYQNKKPPTYVCPIDGTQSEAEVTRKIISTLAYRSLRVIEGGCPDCSGDLDEETLWCSVCEFAYFDCLKCGTIYAEEVEAGDCCEDDEEDL